MGSTKVLFFESTPPYVVAILACKLTHHPWSEKGLSGLFVCFTRDFQFVSPIRGLSTYVGATFKPTWDDFGSDKFFLASFNHAFYGLSSYPKLLATCKLKTSRIWIDLNFSHKILITWCFKNPSSLWYTDISINDLTVDLTADV